MFLIMLNTHVAFVLSVEPLVFNGCKKSRCLYSLDCSV